MCQTCTVSVWVRKVMATLGTNWTIIVASSTFFRSKASATAPANRPKMMKGSASRNPVSPNLKAEPDSWYTW